MEIKKVENLNKKSFLNYTGPEIEFKRVNIFFGYNGKGKSSLAEGIVEQFCVKNNCGKDAYRFFNRNYLDENLLLKENDTIKGVIANFGEKNVNLEKEIAELESKIIDTSGIERSIGNLESQIHDSIDEIKKRRKGNLKIKSKSVNLSIKDLLYSYETDLINARKIASDEELAKTNGDNTFEEKKTIIESIIISEINDISDDEIENVSEIFNRKFDDIEIPTSEIIAWLNDGLKFHKDGDKCKFCGGNLNLKTIQDQVEKFNSNEKQKASVTLNGFLGNLNNFIKEINNILKIKDNLILNFGDEIKEDLDTIESNVSLLPYYCKEIKDKINNMNLDIKFDSQKLKLIISTICESYKTIINIKKSVIEDLEKKISKINDLVKGAIALEILNNEQIKKANNELAKQVEQLKESKNNNEKEIKKIDELKKSKLDTRAFAVFINDILKDLEMNLELDSNGDNYIIKQPKSDKILRIKDISEGELNLLSLLYFYYELFEDNLQTNVKKEIELIVVDDPISSVDDVNKMYVLSLIKNIAWSKIKGPQIFIFTHVWEDFCNITYNRNAKDGNADFVFYEINKKENGSEIVTIDAKETPYKHNFKEIYKFSEKDNAANLSDCEIYHLPNIMRQILEEFMMFKMNDYSTTSGNIHKIIKVLFNSEDIKSKDKMELDTLLAVCNIQSHKSMRQPDQVLKSAKFLMKRIKEVDKVHFDTMRQ